MVGKITNLWHGTCGVKKGQEKGRFEFGGSTNHSASPAWQSPVWIMICWRIQKKVMRPS
ncbi:MAG: hypothetical protein ACLUTA_12605 [Blautia wexlerae]